MLLLVNLNVPSVISYFTGVSGFNGKFFLFTGSYDDFDPRWYNTIGVTILFSMVINIVSTQVAYLLICLFQLLFRCLDSGCSCDGKTTKIRFKLDYYKLYIGTYFDIGLRYSEVTYVLIYSLYLQFLWDYSTLQECL